jgi:TPR repeat protein
VNSSEALRWLTAAAEKGDVLSMALLGDAYVMQQGGFPQDYKAAVAWLRKCAAADSDPLVAHCEHNLSILYRDGLGVGKDEQERLRLLRSSAARGYKPAIEELAKTEKTTEAPSK